MLFQTSPAIVEVDNGNGPALICQAPTIFANEEVGNTVLSNVADDPSVYWQGNGYQLDGTIGYGTTTCDAIKTWSDYNGGSYAWNWHDLAANGVPANGREYILMIDLLTFTRTDEATTYNGQAYTWPSEFMIQLLGYQSGGSGPNNFDTRYLQVSNYAGCYRPVYSGDGNFSAPNYTVSTGLPQFNIEEIGLTVDGNTFVCRFTMQNIDPLQVFATGVWQFGPVFAGSCRFGLIEII